MKVDAPAAFYKEREDDMKITEAKRRVLQIAIDDGGAVDLSGLDWNPGLPRTSMALSIDLHNMGLGRLHTNFGETTFTITDKGREALSQS